MAQQGSKTDRCQHGGSVPPSQVNGSSGGHIACILDPIKQMELVEWLVKRVVFQKNSQGESMQLHLQFEAEAERFVNLVIKVQAWWMRLKSLRCAKEKAKLQCKKIFLRENNVFANRNIRTDEGRLEKQKLLGNNDLRDLFDEWRRESTFDTSTGQKQDYYSSYATDKWIDSNKHS